METTTQQDEYPTPPPPPPLEPTTSPLTTTTTLLTTLQPTTLTTIKPPAFEVNSSQKLVVIVCISVLALLSVICILVIYFCCCKRCFCAKEVTNLFNKSSEPSSELAPFNSAANTIMINNRHSSQLGNGGGARSPPYRVSPEYKSATAFQDRRPTARSSNISLADNSLKLKPTPLTTGRKRSLKSGFNIAAKGANFSAAGGQQVLDKMTITADMFNPTVFRSRKEILLFKSPSFTE